MLFRGNTVIRFICTLSLCRFRSHVPLSLQDLAETPAANNGNNWALCAAGVSLTLLYSFITMLTKHIYCKEVPIDLSVSCCLKYFLSNPAETRVKLREMPKEIRDF